MSEAEAHWGQRMSLNILMTEYISIEHNQHFVTETTTLAGTTEELQYIRKLNISGLEYLGSALYCSLVLDQQTTTTC